MKILLVEDNAVELKLVHSVLARAGHEVRDAASAEEAVQILETEMPHVIMTDLKLPLMDGLAMARWIKQSPRTSSIPVIAMSSYAEDFPRRSIQEAGFAAYLNKPINTRTLCHQVIAAIKPA